MSPSRRRCATPPALTRAVSAPARASRSYARTSLAAARAGRHRRGKAVPPPRAWLQTRLLCRPFWMSVCNGGREWRAVERRRSKMAQQDEQRWKEGQGQRVFDYLVRCPQLYIESWGQSLTYHSAGLPGGQARMEEAADCPLCCTELDVTDRAIRFCECGCERLRCSGLDGCWRRAAAGACADVPRDDQPSDPF